MSYVEDHWVSLSSVGEFHISNSWILQAELAHSLMRIFLVPYSFVEKMELQTERVM